MVTEIANRLPLIDLWAFQLICSGIAKTLAPIVRKATSTSSDKEL